MRNVYRLRLALLSLCAGICHGAPGQSLPDHGSSSASLRPQETTQWCWAASGQMVMATFGRNVAQCTEAQTRFHEPKCCDQTKPNSCIQGGWPEFDKYGFTFATTSNAPLSWDDLRTEIANRKTPFAFSWHWRGGGGHMMVVKGFAVRNGIRYVSILDPWPPKIGDVRDITYENYVEGSNHYHWNDYYHVQLVSSGGGPASPSGPIGEPKPRKSSKVPFSAALADSHEAALKLLQSLQELTPPGPGAEQPAAPKVGVPFANVYVGADELLAAAPGGAAGISELLAPKTDQVLYSAQINGKTRGLLMQKTDDHWDDSGEGNTAVIRQLVAARGRYAKEHHLRLSAFHSVSIPALNAYFVAVKSGAETVLIPVQTDSSIGVVAGEPQPATELLAKLAAAAAEINKHPDTVR